MQADQRRLPSTGVSGELTARCSAPVARSVQACATKSPNAVGSCDDRSGADGMRLACQPPALLVFPTSSSFLLHQTASAASPPVARLQGKPPDPQSRSAGNRAPVRSRAVRPAASSLRCHTPLCDHTHGLQSGQLAQLPPPPRCGRDVPALPLNGAKGKNMPGTGQRAGSGSAGRPGSGPSGRGLWQKFRC